MTMYQKKLEDDIRCPLEYGLEIFGGKWDSRVICVLNEKKVLRYSEIRKEMGNITDAVLSSTLKKLITNGLIQRKSYDEIPPKVEYSLTEKDFRNFNYYSIALKQNARKMRKIINGRRYDTDKATRVAFDEKHIGSFDDYEKLVATAEQCGLKIISDDFCCKLLAWVYMFGAEMEIVTYNVKLRTDISSAQKRLNICVSSSGV